MDNLDAAAPAHIRTCPLCEGMCGVKVTVEDGRPLKVRPDPDNVFSRGHICPKGVALGELHASPDRLRGPVIRDGEGWREVSWEAALERCEALIRPVLAEHGTAAIAAYGGNMIGKSFDLGRYANYLLGSRRVGSQYSSSAVDQLPKNLTSLLMYGDMWRIPVPDIDRTDLFVAFGANPAASKGSILSHRDVMGAIRDLRARGGRMVVVDPVRTGTALAADAWIPITPGADAALLLAVVNVLFAEGLVRLGDLEGQVNGLDALRAAAQPFTPEAVARFCDIDPTVIRDLSRQIAAARSAAVYGRIGLCTQRFGSLASWLIDVVSVLTGNMGRRGGVMFSKQVADQMALSPRYPPDGPIQGRKTRVRGAPSVLGTFPSSCLAEEIDTPGPGQIKGLLTVGANPVLSAPGSERLDRALPLLDFMISLDSYINETTRHAQVILPGPSLLEQPHWDMWGWPWCLTSGGHYSPPLFARPGMAEWRMVMTLGGLLSGRTLDAIDVDAEDDAYFARMCRYVGLDPERILRLAPEHGPERILDLNIRSGPFGDRYGEVEGGLTLERFKAAPHGIIVGEADEGVPLRTTSGKLELAHPYLLADIPRLAQAMAEPPAEAYLVSRRTLRSMNSWMNNVESLATGRARCTLLIHPQDATGLGVTSGDAVTVTSAAGSATVPAEVTDHIKPGVVSLPHGWGHDRPGARLSVARRRPGVNANSLNPPDLLDTISGNAVVNGTPVTLSKAQATTRGQEAGS